MNSADLPAWMWKNPEEVAARTQAMSCHGCALIVKTLFQWQVVESCGKGRRFGKKCKQYLETGNAN